CAHVDHQLDRGAGKETLTGSIGASFPMDDLPDDRAERITCGRTPPVTDPAAEGRCRSSLDDGSGLAPAVHASLRFSLDQGALVPSRVPPADHPRSTPGNLSRYRRLSRTSAPLRSTSSASPCDQGRISRMASRLTIAERCTRANFAGSSRFSISASVARARSDSLSTWSRT